MMHKRIPFFTLSLVTVIVFADAANLRAGVGEVLSHQKISSGDGNFNDTLDSGDHFGSAVVRLGDLDGDGVGDLAVGVGGDDDGGSGHGAVWVLFLNSDETVKTHQKISDTQGGFAGVLDESDWFGESVASLGDLDGDGVVDLAVGAYGDDDGGISSNRGAVWVLFLNSDGTVKAHQKISSTEGDFGGLLNLGDQFGLSVASLGDLDGDGIVDLAVGANGDGELGRNRGAVWVLFLNSDGTVKAHQKINDAQGNFAGTLDDFDSFGGSVASIGDLDGDTVADLAVTAGGDDDGGSAHGAVWVLFLNSDGRVKSHQKISDTEGNFTGIIGGVGGFGGSVGSLGDIDGDSVDDLAVGAVGDDDGGQDRGAVWVLFLNSDGTVKAHQKISDTQGNFDGTLDDTDRFGSSVTYLGDLDGDGKGDLAVGAWLDDDGGLNHGALWVLFLNSNGTVKAHQKLSDTDENFAGTLDPGDTFGLSITSLGGLDGDTVTDIAVLAGGDDDGPDLTGEVGGAVWVLFLNSDGTVKSYQKISDTHGNFSGNGGFGGGITSLGDLDGDGVVDLAVGANRDDDGGSNRGAVWVLFLNSDGTVKAQQKISDTQGNFTGVLDDDDWFGSSVTSLGDLDGDGVLDLAVGAYADDDGGSGHGAVWVLFLNTNGTVKAHQKISDTEGNFTPSLSLGDEFGYSVASLGDLDGDDVGDLAVGAHRSDVGGGINSNLGVVWVLFLNSNGTVKAHQQISATQGGFTGTLNDGDQFGNSVAALGDLDGDGVQDLTVGAVDDDGGFNRGAVWVLFLNSDGTVKGHQKISNTQGNFTGTLDNEDRFGNSVAALGDLNSDGKGDLAVGAVFDDEIEGNQLDNRGAVWVLFLDGAPLVPVLLQSYDSRWTGDLVEVTWRLIDIEGELTFDVWRRNGSSDGFAKVHNPEITRRGGDFVFVDHNAKPAETYSYRVIIIEDGRVVTSFETTTTTPALQLALEQNHPNPFNPATRIDYTVDKKAAVHLGVYDISGKLVRVLVDQSMPAGTHSAQWNGRDNGGQVVASGIYFYRLTVGKRSLARKAVLLK